MSFRWTRLLNSGALLVFASLLACSRNESPPVAVLQLSLPGDPDSIDPLKAYLKTGIWLVQATHESLTRPDPKGRQALPGVAHSWEHSPDFRQWRFHLREDAKWSDGTPVMAADFARTIARAADPATACPNAAAFFNLDGFPDALLQSSAARSISGISAVAPHTLEVKLIRADSDFPNKVWAHFWAPTSAATNPDTLVNGPYRIQQYRRGAFVSLSVNEHYWNRAALNYPQIRLNIFDDPYANERAFRSNQIHISNFLPWAVVARYAADPRHPLHVQAISQVNYVVFNTRIPVLANVHFRQDLSKAINRLAICTKILQGGEKPAYAFTLNAIAADPDEGVHASGPTAASLDWAGLPELRLAITGDSTLAEALQEMWRKTLNVKVRIERREPTAHYAAMENGDFDLAIGGYFSDFPGPGVLSLFTSTEPNNFSAWSSAEYDQTLATAEGAPNEHEHGVAYARAEMLLREQRPAFPLYFGVARELVSPSLEWTTDAFGNRYYLSLRPTGSGD